MIKLLNFTCEYNMPAKAQLKKKTINMFISIEYLQHGFHYLYLFWMYLTSFI